MSVHVHLDDPGNAVEFADFIELDLLYSGEASSSRAEIVSAVGTRGVHDEQVEFALAEISRREARLGDVYPFKLDSSLVRRRSALDDEVRLYEFLQLCSSQGTEFRKEKQYAQADQIFDEVIARAMKALLGEGSRSIVFANPSLYSFSDETRFPERIDDLGRVLGVGGHGPLTPEFGNDGGVDVVAWRRFGDQHHGFLTILMQNTIRDRYIGKRTDIQVEEWSKYLPGAGAMARGMAVPHLIDGATANFVGIGSHVVLDRLRVCELLGPEPLIDSTFAKPVEAFIGEQLDRGEDYVGDGVVRPKRQRRPKN